MLAARGWTPPFPYTFFHFLATPVCLYVSYTSKIKLLFPHLPALVAKYVIALVVYRKSRKFGYKSKIHRNFLDYNQLRDLKTMFYVSFIKYAIIDIHNISNQTVKTLTKIYLCFAKNN